MKTRILVVETLNHIQIIPCKKEQRGTSSTEPCIYIYISSTFHLKFTECTSYDPPTNKQPVPPLVVSMAFSWEYFWCSFSPLVVFFGLNNDLVDPQFWSLFLVNVTPGPFFWGNLDEGEIWISILARWGYVHWPPQWVPKGWTLRGCLRKQPFEGSISIPGWRVVVHLIFP